MSKKDYLSNARLIQSSRVRGEKRGFEIYNNKFMRIANSSSMGKNRSYHLNLALLEPKPVRHIHISWLWLVIFLFMSGTSFVVSDQLTGGQNMENQLPYVIILGVLSLTSFVLFVVKSHNSTEFRSRFSKTPLVTLLQNNPGRKEFRQFIETLSKHAAITIQKSGIDDTRMATIELSEIRRLKDDGILTEKDYERAKKKIMKLHS